MLGGLGVGNQQNGLFVIYFCGAGLNSKSADQNQKHLSNCNNAFMTFAEETSYLLKAKYSTSFFQVAELCAK
jgi:hypothetical protein